MRWSAAIRLGLLCLAAVLTLSLLADRSAPRIAAQQQAHWYATLGSVLATDLQISDAIAQPLQVDAAALGVGHKRIWRAQRAQRVEALVLEASTEDGYNGRIEVLIGVRLPDATRSHSDVLAVRVTSHRETPGLGDGIDRERSDWIDQFAGKSLRMPAYEHWRSQRDGGAFDTLASATVSSRALIELNARVLRFVDTHADALRSAPSGSQREYADAE
jgi:Na+-translocating ferredoxin:NAD+ oxidoreductase subunit G